MSCYTNFWEIKFSNRMHLIDYEKGETLSLHLVHRIQVDHLLQRSNYLFLTVLKCEVRKPFRGIAWPSLMFSF